MDLELVARRVVAQVRGTASRTELAVAVAVQVGESRRTEPAFAMQPVQVLRHNSCNEPRALERHERHVCCRRERRPHRRCLAALVQLALGLKSPKSARRPKVRDPRRGRDARACKDHALARASNELNKLSDFALPRGRSLDGLRRADRVSINALRALGPLDGVHQGVK
eukprot:Amastigsp_a508535_595.p3 type:complete len:168 gc:universal Amastigsp_a508535_595:981-1484(+)